MSRQRDYDSTVARIAGNIASGMAEKAWNASVHSGVLAEWCVEIARAIVAETQATEPTEAAK